MLDGWKRDGAEAGMFIRILDMATFILRLVDADVAVLLSSFTLQQD